MLFAFVLQTYVNWGENKPNNVDKTEHCVAMGRDGKYNDEDCARRNKYICEMLLVEATDPTLPTTPVTTPVSTPPTTVDTTVSTSETTSTASTSRDVSPAGVEESPSVTGENKTTFGVGEGTCFGEG